MKTQAETCASQQWQFVCLLHHLPCSQFAWLKFFLLKFFLLRCLLGAWACFLRLPGVMPLSKEQMDLLKDGNTPIQFAKDNPKKVGSKAWDRYEQYKDANSISQVMEKKAGWQDLTKKAGWQDLAADFEKGFLKIMKDMDVEMEGPTKKPAPESTPDREAQARTKSQASTLIPRSLPTEIEDPISKAEISAATLTALRMVMREEITHGVSAMESRLMNRMDEQMQNMQEEIEKEKAARGLLESRLHNLEAKENMKIDVDKMDDEVDKSIAVIGGFGEKGIEEAEDVLKELLAHINGFQDVNLVESNSGVLGSAQFDTPSNAFKFVRSQKKHAGIQHAGLLVAENRTRAERNRSKIVNKLKKCLIELGNMNPKDVMVSYKVFKVVVRVGSKLIPLASMDADIEVHWHDAEMPSADVKKALEEFIANME